MTTNTINTRENNRISIVEKRLDETVTDSVEVYTSEFRLQQHTFMLIIKHTTLYTVMMSRRWNFEENKRIIIHIILFAVNLDTFCIEQEANCGNIHIALDKNGNFVFYEGNFCNAEVRICGGNNFLDCFRSFFHISTFSISGAGNMIWGRWLEWSEGIFAIIYDLQNGGKWYQVSSCHISFAAKR